jgi:hypothetical protein
MHVAGGARTAGVRTPGPGRMFHIPQSRMVGS